MYVQMYMHAHTHAHTYTPGSPCAWTCTYMCFWGKDNLDRASLLAQTIKNLPAIQETPEATVRTRHGTDQFKTGKGVRQGCLPSPCSFNLYAECMCLSRLSHVRLFATLGTIACQSPLSMGFSRQEHWRELPCLPPGDLPNPQIIFVSPVTPALQAVS